MNNLYKKIRSEIPSSVPNSAVRHMANECDHRLGSLDMDVSEILGDNLSIWIDETESINMRKDELYGIYWSFDKRGNLTDT